MEKRKNENEFIEEFEEMVEAEEEGLQYHDENEIEELTVRHKVTKEEKEDLDKALGDKKLIRYLTDQYYQSQSYRIKAENQARSLMQGYDNTSEDVEEDESKIKKKLNDFMGDPEQPEFIKTEVRNARAQEAINKAYIDYVTDRIPICAWMKKIYGIGPILSAVCYSYFQMERDRYNTNFLSYAGLNDNNNPWLGVEKANALVKEALVHAGRKFSTSMHYLYDLYLGENLISTDEKDREKFLKALKQIYKGICKNSEDGYEVLTGEILDEAFYKAFKGEPHTPADRVENLTCHYTDIEEYLLLDLFNYVGNTIYSYCSLKTGRNIINIINGAERNRVAQKNPKARCTKADLASYLAKPPYNKELKKRMYLIGCSFVKQNAAKSLYARIYRVRKAEESAKNDQLFYADQAQHILDTVSINEKKTLEVLESGRLTAGHIDMRARRYAVKLFISHLYEAMYYWEYNEEPPKTYIIAHKNHHNYIGPEVDYHEFLDKLR